MMESESIALPLGDTPVAGTILDQAWHFRSIRVNQECFIFRFIKLKPWYDSLKTKIINGIRNETPKTDISAYQRL